MKTFLKFLLLSMAISVSHEILAQNMRQYDVTSGLSTNTIKGMIQDSRGYIWFATSDGLNLFNGTTFSSYGCSYSSNKQDGFNVVSITYLLQHKDGVRIWAATHNSPLVLFDPDTGTFKEIKLDRNSTELPPPVISYALTYDKTGDLWIGTDSGIYIYKEELDSLSVLSTQNSNIASDIVQCIHCDTNGIIWVGGDKGLSRYNPVTCKFSHITDNTHSGSKDINIATISEGLSETLWIGTWDRGLYVMDKKSNTLRKITPTGDNRYAGSMRVRKILPDTSEIIWLCTNVGLFRYHIPHNRMEQVILSATHPNDNIYTCMKDSEGGIWIGTFFQGVYYLSPKARHLGCHTPQNAGAMLRGTAISSFCEDRSGNIFIASENGGLSIFDPVTEKFRNAYPYTAGENIHALCMEDSNLYVGTFSTGLKHIDLKRGTTRTYTKSGYPRLVSDDIFSLYCNRSNELYIGTREGCSVFDIGNMTFSVVEELKGKFIYDIQGDKRGNIWFACYYDGIYRYSLDNGSWTHYAHDPEDYGSLSSDKAIGLHIDDKETLWICTEGGGVCNYDYETDSFNRLIIRQDGTEINLAFIYGILNDHSGNLWLTSNNGVWVCAPDGEVIRHLTHEDGLQSNQHNFGAAYRSRTGRLYLGGINGFNMITPESIHDCQTPPTATARIRYRGKDGKICFSPKVYNTGMVSIPRNIMAFSIDFECLSYFSPDKNVYAYKIDDEDPWTYSTESNVNFLNFPTGKHIIKVKARNGDRQWSRNEVILHIDNLPPIYESIAAKIIYIILTITCIIIIILSIEKRRSLESKEKLEKIRVRQEQEAYKAKIHFFTHVAHEIKTPVTLIKAPLEVVIRKEKDESNRHNLIIIKKNADRLLNLVNQLLDFKKISSEGHEISMVAAYPQDLIRNVTTRFDESTLDGISISFSSVSERICCILDPEAYTKIVSNLMTNAVKHARSRVEVNVGLCDSQNGKVLHLAVKDDGPGIPLTEQKKIFETFYQIETHENPKMYGVGLGLSLVKLLVQKHNGSVYVDSSYKEGCCFCVDLPYICPEKEKRVMTEDSTRTDTYDLEDGDRLKLLIVEDTADMLDFISTIFENKHEILKASNGKDALEILENQEVDIIISDISMPLMNGFELLQEIRKNDLLCHIPVIILTVEGALETRIKGLEYGADAYIEKPFSTPHLIATVNNLISRRESMRKRLIVSPFKKEADAISSVRDKDWFERVTKLIQDNISEPEISIENVAMEMNLSRSSFQRKIKGLTGLSPVEFIRVIRLKKAADLLSTGCYRINEVSYMVGFNKPSYFSALFKKQFGVLPKDFVNQK